METTMINNKIEELLGEKAESLLTHECKTISKELLHKPGPDFIDRIFINSNRSNQVIRNLNSIYTHENFR